jgi:leucyl-tRNA synthetase
LHVTEPETATGHLLDTRILSAALQDGDGLTPREPWEELVLIGDVLDSAGKDDPESLVWESDALRVAVLADAPPDRELEWSDKRYAGALKFVGGANRLFSPNGGADGLDKASLARRVGKASARLESALHRRRTNAAVAAAREIVGEAAKSAERTGLDNSALVFLASLLFPLLPDLAAKGLGTAASLPITPPTWPDIREHQGDAELVELIVQINGKKCGTLQVARAADEEVVIAAIRADQSLRVHLGENSVRKIILVTNRLVNLVI